MLVEVEPRDHLGYSNDYRPDVSVAGAGRSRSRLIGDVKFKDSLSSNPEDVGQRGAFVGLGNTEPGTSADVFGLEQRGAVGDGDFRPSDGGGYVAYKKADYAHALSRSDTDVQMYLFETFGGWCNAVKRLFYQMKDKVRNKLSKRQHEDEASWSTRSWLSLQAQRCQSRCSSRRRKRLRPSSGSPRRRRTPPSPRLPCVTTCLSAFVAWRLCPVCAASRAPEFILLFIF